MGESKATNMQENFRRVYIELLFLLLLTKEDMYGFQLSSELKTMSNGVFDFKQIRKLTSDAHANKKLVKSLGGSFSFKKNGKSIKN